jgi:hypothetical protein
MKIKSLDKLKKYNDLYDLHIDVLSQNISYAVYTFSLLSKHSCRIDLVCQDIYSTTEHIDILSTINGLLNVFSINEGDILYFIDEKDIDVVRNNDNILNDIINELKKANTGKEQKKDNNRLQDKINRQNIEKNKKLPGNINTKDNQNIEIIDGSIILKPNF